MKRGWIILMLALVCGIAVSQTTPPADAERDNDAPAAGTEEATPPGAADTAAEANAAQTDEVAVDGQAPGAADSAGDSNIKATMRKFVPSEQISEDSSVAFPNDI